MRAEGLSRLTPFFPARCEGVVHSVFQRVVNLQMEWPGETRMLVLVSSGLPALPDSICLPEEMLVSLTVGQPVRLAEQHLFWEQNELLLQNDESFTGKLSLLSLREGFPCASALEALTADLSCGFDRFPSALRNRADAALLEGRWQEFLGLGNGLTPSFDDACVGMAAVYTAVGCPIPPLSDLAVTTDVSARYLQLAQEAYFGQPLLDLIHALWQDESALQEAVHHLEAIGATSGRDMLYGVRLALRKFRSRFS